MPAAYSMDLRIRVVETADELNLSDEEARETFKVGEATVRRGRRLMRELKGVLRSAGALTRETLDAAIVAAMERVTLSDLLGWFTHRGYRAQAA